MEHRDYTKWKIPQSEKDSIPQILEKIKNNEHSSRPSKNPEKLIGYYLDKWKLCLENINFDFENPKIINKLKTFINDFKSDKIRKTITKWVGEKGKEELKEVDAGAYKDKKKFIQSLRVYVTLRFDEDDEQFEELQSKLLRLINKTKFYKEDKEVKTLEPEEIEKLIVEANSEYGARIEVEGTGGTREGETDSILMKGVKLANPTNKKPFVELEITQSKTSVRPIKLYSPKSQERIKAFYDKRISDGANPNDKFFTKSHSAFRQYLKRLGNKVLKKHIHPHMLRASAVTNNIEKGLVVNESEMNTFYGWKHGTGTCRKYINSDKLTLKETDKRANEKIFGENPKTIEELEFEKKIEIEAIKKEMREEFKKFRLENEFWRAHVVGKTWETIPEGKKVYIPKYPKGKG